MQKTIIDKHCLLASLDIEQVALRLGIEVKRHWACCPFHLESGPSLSFTPSKGLWHCFGCLAGGDSITLTMKSLDLDFIPACIWLDEQFNCGAIEYINETETADTLNTRRARQLSYAVAEQCRKRLFVINRFLTEQQVKQYDTLSDDTTAYEGLCGEVYLSKQLQSSKDNDTVTVETRRLTALCEGFEGWNQCVEYWGRWDKMVFDIEQGKEPSKVIDKYLKCEKRYRADEQGSK